MSETAGMVSRHRLAQVGPRWLAQAGDGDEPARPSIHRYEVHTPLRWAFPECPCNQDAVAM